MSRWFPVALVLFVPSFASAAEEPAHRVKGDLAIQARDILHRYCADCHTGSPDPGRSKLKMLDHGAVTATKTKGAFVAPGGRSQLLELIKDGSMPPANKPGPSAAEIAVLEKWVKEGAPKYPQAFDERYILEAVAADFDRESGKIRDGNGGEYLRYASFAHFICDGEPPRDIGAAERQLNEALTLATGGAPVKVAPIDPAANVFRIDLNGLGWWTRELFEKVEGRKSAGVHPLRPHDLLLLEYPFGEQRPPADNARTNRLEKLLGPKSQVRPVPYIRGDWLATALANGKSLTPLAEDIRNLAQLNAAYKRNEAAPKGREGPRPFGTAKSIVVPRPTAGNSAIPPLSGWYGANVISDPTPFTLTADLIVDGKKVESVVVNQPFKLRISSDRARRYYFTLLMVLADGEVRVQKVLGGDQLLEGETRELGPNADGFSIAGITSGGNSATEYFVLFASEAELPLPTILRSTHSDFPIWRFLLEPTAKYPFDPSKVVRKVVPIPVTKK